MTSSGSIGEVAATRHPSLRITAVGDIAFEGEESDRPTLQSLAGIRQALSSADLVVGNLECPLVDHARPIPGKCTMRGARGWAGVLKQAGFRVLSLANNHAMDHGESGLFSTINALDAEGIIHVGAGRDHAEACAPRFVQVDHRRVGFLARSSVVVSARTYAAPGVPGVAFLDVPETCRAIEECRTKCDIVVLLVHWGIEEYLYPSPDQRREAALFAAAGADAIFGHHPHVMQGAEYIGRCPVLYSVGNFLFSEFVWTYTTPRGEEIAQLSGLSRQNRKVPIATLEWSGSGQPAIDYAFARIEDACRVVMEEDTDSTRQMAELSAALGRPFYPTIWRLYALRREWQLRGKTNQSLRDYVGKLNRLRPRHIAEGVGAIRRSLRVVFGKSTNPYE